MDHPSIKEDMKKKMQEYVEFVRTRLKPDFERCQLDKQNVQREINDYRALQTQLTQLVEKSTASDGDKHSEGKEEEILVDLAHETVFCNAVVDKPADGDDDHVYVHVGMGFHAELTYSEALAFVERRISLLENDKLKQRNAECQKVLDHLESSQLCLDQLAAEIRKLG